MMPSLFIRTLFLLLPSSALFAVDAFSSSSSSASATSSTDSKQRRGSERLGAGGIQIVGLPGGKVESLPQMYVGAFRRWIVTVVVEEKEDGNDNESSLLCSNSKIKTMVAIPGAGGYDTARGWVDPTTTNELWWPNDILSLQVRPTLDILVRNGMISYVSAGLDVRVSTTFSKSSSSEEEEKAEKESWRNHGLNSQPISRLWTTLDIALEYNFHIEGFIVGLQQDEHCDESSDATPSSSIDAAEDDTATNRINEKTTKILFPRINNDNVRTAINSIATYLAEVDDEQQLLLKGFHIISYPLMKEWIDIPSSPTLTPTRICSEDNNEKENDSTNTNSNMEETVLYTIICMGTSEPDASKLLSESDDMMDEELLIMSSTSVLEMDVITTMGGSKSQYLPEVYKKLCTPT
jgi:hypothetical protein